MTASINIRLNAEFFFLDFTVIFFFLKSHVKI